MAKRTERSAKMVPREKPFVTTGLRVADWYLYEAHEEL